MKNNMCLYLLMIADKNMEYMERTIESILAQTLDHSRLRVLIMDNASTDGTYQRLIGYEIKYPQLISVIREKQPTTRGRLFKRMIQHLRFSDVEFSMLMEPGDIIYPDGLKKAAAALRVSGQCRCAVFETDLWDGESVKKQTSIYRDNCILNQLCSINNYTDGIGHKVQVLFRGLPIDLSMKLPYFSIAADQNEWFTQLFYPKAYRMYVKEPLGCIAVRQTEDVVDDLVRKTFFLKRNFYAVETSVFSSFNAADVEKEELAAGYRLLAITALQSAVEKLECGDFKQAEDCLIYAEMMDLDITGELLYQEIKRVLDEGSGDVSRLREMLVQESLEPPRESFVF